MRGKRITITDNDQENDEKKEKKIMTKGFNSSRINSSF